MFGAKLAEILEIEFPIIQGGMAHISTGAFAAAVSDAGGMGMIATASQNAGYVRKQIRSARRLTARAFGVNVMLANPHCRAIVDVILEEGVKIIATGAGSPEPYMKDLLDNGCTVLPVIPHVRAAVKMEDLGAAAVIAEGCESGGHVGTVSTIALVPMVTNTVKIPVIAAGGIADGKGFLAALAMGAVGIQMGTVFLATTESPISQAYKERLLTAKETDTVVTGMGTKDPVRGIRNELTDRYFEMVAQCLPQEDVMKPLTGSLARAVAGDMVNGSIQAGQIAGMICKIKTVREVMVDVMASAEKAWCSINNQIESS